MKNPGCLNAYFPLYFTLRKVVVTVGLGIGYVRKHKRSQFNATVLISLYLVSLLFFSVTLFISSYLRACLGLPIIIIPRWIYIPLLFKSSCIWTCASLPLSCMYPHPTLLYLSLHFSPLISLSMHFAEGSEIKRNEQITFYVKKKYIFFNFNFYLFIFFFKVWK